MRFKPLSILILFSLLTFSAEAQDTGCKPDLTVVTTELGQAQTATDSASMLVFLTNAKNALDQQVAACINYAPETAGDKRTNPVSFGERKAFELADEGKASIQIVKYIDNANEYAQNFKVDESKRLIGIEILYTCDSSPDATCTIGAYSGFSVVGSESIDYDSKKTNTLPNGEGATLYGGGQANYSMAFLVDKDDADFVLVAYPSFGIDPVYFALQ